MEKARKRKHANDKEGAAMRALAWMQSEFELTAMPNGTNSLTAKLHSDMLLDEPSAKR